MNFKINIPGRSLYQIERSVDEDDMGACRDSQLKSYSNTFCVSNSENTKHII